MRVICEQVQLSGGTYVGTYVLFFFSLFVTVIVTMVLCLCGWYCGAGHTIACDTYVLVQHNKLFVTRVVQTCVILLLSSKYQYGGKHLSLQRCSLARVVWCLCFQTPGCTMLSESCMYPAGVNMRRCLFALGVWLCISRQLVVYHVVRELQVSHGDACLRMV